jgi:hypothetical protein
MDYWDFGLIVVGFTLGMLFTASTMMVISAVVISKQLFNQPPPTKDTNE